MRILLVADQEEPYLWDYYQPGRLAGCDLILSAGDLKSAYLEFLVTMANKPLLYVPGNHDVSYLSRPPEGCDCVDGLVTECGGLRILGLGGCMRYNLQPYQYTEKEMAKRIRQLRRRIRSVGGLDLILTHAPPLGMGDGDDLCHRGFACFLELIDEYQPKYFIHGHQHLNYRTASERILRRGGTTVVNACGRYELEL